MPAKKATKSTKKTSTRSKRSVPKRSSRQSVKERQEAEKISLWSRLTLDRKLDILGIGMVLLGLLTLLSLVSRVNGWLFSGWISLIGKGFGWGMYLLPIGLIALGLWLILRHFDQLPRLELGRLLGLLFLFTLLLGWLHFFTLPTNRAAIFELAEQNRGGGYLGGALLVILEPNLGLEGAAITLLAGTLIALAFSLDLSIPEMFGWLAPIFMKIQSSWEELRKLISNKTTRAIVPLPAAGISTVEAATVADPPDAESGVVSPEKPGVKKVWVLPVIDEILEPGGEISFDDEFDRQRARLIEDTLASFGAPARVVEINRGPTITQFGVEPGFIESRSGQMRVRVNKISSLADDLALTLSAKRIRIQAPVPGKSYVGIEVPNEAISLVALRDVLESEAFQRLKSPLRFALGQDVAGHPAAADLAAMPHLLIAGATGSGKSVSVNAIICGLLLNNTPDDLRMLMVDPKRVELTGYNGIPHLLAPVVVDLERVVGALQWVAREMDQRYNRLAQAGARNIVDYNKRLAAQGEQRLPYLVVVIDELADLMMLAPDETERTITRLAQLARATGIHLVISTQRPSVDVVTGLIKANFPARIAFAVASGVDSRVILDQPGAERLLGRGDMLFQAPDAAAPVRLQGTFVSDPEIQRLVTYWRRQAGDIEAAPMATQGVVDSLPSGIPLKQIPLWEQMEPEEDLDPLFDEAVDMVRRQGRASISMLQRRLRIGYTRAARLIETMQEKGIVGPPQPGTQGLEVLDYGPAAPPVDGE
ncbi:MAG: DNA translocase FtsK 4TM domain-containing protein [Chloroflexota bacterium]|nr:MAG: DNA translocase FtsK 4TM domain-containing protein [Chloroflexota bacterium]